MSDEPYRLAVILGSVREGRFGPRVADWLREEVIDRRTDLVADHLDLAKFQLPHNLDGSGDTTEFCERLGRADAFVVITPEYNHGFPGGLKTAIDTARPEWAGKPAALVSYGGVAGGLRSVEMLRLVLTELQVATIRRALSFHPLSLI
ncbi:NAD(P)H-dependent oxidoreductase, partial [Actinospica durhamensis]